MRDPNRIDGYCERLVKIWKQVPDWRFGQLVVNLARIYQQQTGHDIFFREDDKLFPELERIFQVTPWLTEDDVEDEEENK